MSKLLKTNISVIRQEYTKSVLTKDSVSRNPFEQFELWWRVTLKSKIKEPNAMTLATSNHQGEPNLRTVLLKNFDNQGFIFFTNYQSEKASEISENPNVAVLFFWKELERQVKVKGTLKKTSTFVSNKYFATRPRKSQIGAWASAQSETISQREELENHFKALSKRYKNKKKIARPKNWGGYILKPCYFEFWQGRPSRLHDRIIYKQNNKKKWIISRLQP